MGFRVEPYKGKRSPDSVGMSRSRGSGLGEEMEEMQELFEQMMSGEAGEAGEGLEDFDWTKMWDDFMEEEGSQEQLQGSQYPTMFGAPIRPSGFRRDGGQVNNPLNMNYY